MSKINDGGCAFPFEGGTNNGYSPDPGMTLRDWFATSVDKDEYGDLLYRNASLKMKELLAGECPQEPTSKRPEDRASWQLAKLDWDLRVSAAIRYRMADAMLAAREGETP